MSSSKQRSGVASALKLGQRCLLKLPSDMALLPVALQFVRELAALCGFESGQIDQLELVVEEAVTNVFRHAYAPGEPGDMELMVERVARGLEIRVRDQGLPYDPTLTPEFDPERAGEPGEPDGLGTFLMRRLMDEVEYRNLGRGGKELRLLKILSTPAVFDEGPASEAAPPPPTPTPSREPMAARELDLHLMRPEEAVEVARCFYEAYGYTYAGEYMYYPERLAAMNASGELVSAVATDRESGEVAAHIAMVVTASEPAVAELGKAATKPRFRGRSVAEQLTRFLFETAAQRGFEGVFGEAVTAHTYSQRFAHRLGFVDCGFALALYPATMSFRGIASELSQRETLVLSYRHLSKPQACPCFAPLRHQAAIRKIYDGFDLDVRFGDEAEPAPSARHSELSVTIDPFLSIATMTVETVGADVIKRFRQEIFRMRREGIPVAWLMLDMARPSTAWLAARLEQELGFLFTGILPGAAGHDRLVLQRFNGIAIDYDAIKLDSNAARALLGYIRMNDPGQVG